MLAKSDQSDQPVAAGKSSFDLVDADAVFKALIPAEFADTPGTFADLACGVGRYTVALSQRVAPGSRILALDLWQEGLDALLESARECRCGAIETHHTDLTAPLPIASGSVDGCLLATALHDLPESARIPLLAEVARVLKRDGRLVLVEFKVQDHGPGPEAGLRIQPQTARYQGESAGLVAHDPVDVGEFTYMMVFTKAAP